MSRGRFYLYTIVLVALAGVVAAQSFMREAAHADQMAFFGPIVEVKRALSEQYVDTVDEVKLQKGAIQGMLEALGDPYTVFVPAEDVAEFSKDLTGEYVGIGAQVNIVEGWLTIATPLEDSPAYRAGIEPDDRVSEIEGVSTHGMKVEKCVELLMGKPGTQVNIVIERKGKRIPMTITRDKIKTRSVKGFHRSFENAQTWLYLIDPARKVGYVRIAQFTPGVSDELGAALKTMGAQTGELKGLILDLRWNGGGLLNEAIAIADLLLEDGVIVSTRGRAHPEQVSRAKKEGTLANFPIAVLLNEASASASEVLAGALVENSRAIAVGTRSFGKGSVQTIRRVERGGGELKLTEQGYFLPSGRSLSRKDDSAAWGVDPTEGFYVPLTDSEVREMFRIRRQEDVLTQGGSVAAGPMGANDPEEMKRWADPAWIVDRLKDKQLGAALKAVQGHVESGRWQATGQAGGGKQIAADELKRLNQTLAASGKSMQRLERRIEALEGAAGDAAAPPTDLWPDTAEIAGGTVKITDKDGKVIAELEITGADLERWLAFSDVKKKDAPKPAPTP